MWILIGLGLALLVGGLFVVSNGEPIILMVGVCIVLGCLLGSVLFYDKNIITLKDEFGNERSFDKNNLAEIEAFKKVVANSKWELVTESPRVVRSKETGCTWLMQLDRGEARFVGEIECPKKEITVSENL